MKTVATQKPRLAAALGALFVLCAHHAAAEEKPADETPVAVGNIYDANAQPMTEAALAALIASADFLLLGETHTSAATHDWQARLLETYATSAKATAVVFEMIPQDLQPALDAYLQSQDVNASGIGDAVNWEQRGWPDWAIYQPIAEVALRHGLGIVAGDLPRTDIQAIGKDGTSALPQDKLADFGLDRSLPADDAANLETILNEAHCGLLPQSALAPMATVQRARDGALADALITAGGAGERVALIAGNGHVRRDFGVPSVLQARRPDTIIVAIGLLETSEEPQPVSAYGLTGANGAPLYDAVVFTGPYDDTDHCAELREQMGKKDG